MRTEEDDQRICLHESAHVVLVHQLFQRALISVTVEPGFTKKGVEYEGQTRWQDDEGDLAIARQFKGKSARIIRKRSNQLVDAFFQHAIDSLLISVAGKTAERIFLGSSGDMHGSDMDNAAEIGNVVFQSVGAIKYLIIAAEIECEALLAEYRHLVLALAAELRIKRRLNGAEINELIASANVEHEAMRKSKVGAIYERMQARQRMVINARGAQC